MAKVKNAPAPNGAGAGGGIARTFKLARPITDDKGQEWSEITLVEPELHHRAKAQRAKTATQTEQSINMFSALASVPEAAIRRMKARDAFRLKAWLDQVTVSGLLADMAAEKLAAEKFDGADAARLEGERTFELLCPIETNGAALARVTVREPDLEAGIAVERMELAADQTAALIASCSGLTMPVVMRMKLRDIARIERWLDFFSLAGEELAAGEEAREAPTAGAT